MPHERKVASCLNIILPAAIRAGIMTMAACAKAFPAIHLADLAPAFLARRARTRKTAVLRARVRLVSARHRGAVLRRADAKSASTR